MQRRLTKCERAKKESQPTRDVAVADSDREIQTAAKVSLPHVSAVAHARRPSPERAAEDDVRERALHIHSQLGTMSRPCRVPFTDSYFNGCRGNERQLPLAPDKNRPTRLCSRLDRVRYTYFFIYFFFFAEPIDPRVRAAVPWLLD